MFLTITNDIYALHGVYLIPYISSSKDGRRQGTGFGRLHRQVAVRDRGDARRQPHPIHVHLQDGLRESRQPQVLPHRVRPGHRPRQGRPQGVQRPIQQVCPFKGGSLRHARHRLLMLDKTSHRSFYTHPSLILYKQLSSMNLLDILFLILNNHSTITHSNSQPQP